MYHASQNFTAEDAQGIYKIFNTTLTTTSILSGEEEEERKKELWSRRWILWPQNNIAHSQHTHPTKLDYKQTLIKVQCTGCLFLRTRLCGNNYHASSSHPFCLYLLGWKTFFFSFYGSSKIHQVSFVTTIKCFLWSIMLIWKRRRRDKPNIFPHEGIFAHWRISPKQTIILYGWWPENVETDRVYVHTRYIPDECKNNFFWTTFFILADFPAFRCSTKYNLFVCINIVTWKGDGVMTKKSLVMSRNNFAPLLLHTYAYPMSSWQRIPSSKEITTNNNIWVEKNVSS